MARCTAPINGHRTASGRANCPVCGADYRKNSYFPSYSLLNSLPTNGYKSSYNGQTKVKARWASSGSTALYSPAEIRTLTPIGLIRIAGYFHRIFRFKVIVGIT